MRCVPRGSLRPLAVRLGRARAGDAVHGLRPQCRDGFQPLGRPPHRQGRDPAHGRARNTRRQNPGAACATFVAVNALLFVATAATINRLAACCRLWRCPSYWFTAIASASPRWRIWCSGCRSASLPSGLTSPSRGVSTHGVAVHPGAAGDDLVRGFDIIYALQDAEFDRQHGLHSIPACFSARSALGCSVFGLHAVSIAALGWFGTYCPGSVWLWLGAGVFTGLLVLEHLLVTPCGSAISASPSGRSTAWRARCWPSS